jgi:hypothetical protein
MFKRDEDLVPVIIPISSTNSNAMKVDGQAFGAIEFPAAMTGATMSIEGRDGADAAWLPILSSVGTAQTIAFVASSIVRLPDVVFACRELRLVSDGTEAAERTLYLHAKS